jgi:hypothetical protein
MGSAEPPHLITQADGWRNATGRYSMTVRKVFTWLFVAFLIFFVAYRPASAAAATKWIGGALSGLATGFGDFFSHLF